METVETLVIGAGVVGLAIARALARSGREVVIVEKEDLYGSGVSSRNSEVIHAGLYYRKDSLKARFCVEGKHMLYDYCETRKVAAKQCGKLVVATNDDELQTMGAILKKAHDNGVTDTVLVSREETLAREPALSCTGAMWSPSTGIVDSHGLMASLLGEAEDHGAMLALNAPVTAITLSDPHVVEVGGETPMTLGAKEVINSAGLGANALAKVTTGVGDVFQPALFYAKGCYFSLTGRSPFTTLIYPAPVQGGLGVHLTLDIGGQAKFGPDVDWVDEESYDVPPDRGDKFYDAVRRYWPDLKDGALTPDYAGVRPKIVPKGAADGDFRIIGPAEHGMAGYVGLFGIESPGLTSSLAIAKHVTSLL